MTVKRAQDDPQRSHGREGGRKGPGESDRGSPTKRTRAGHGAETSHADSERE